MALDVRAVGDRFTVTVDLPPAEPWQSPGPITATEVIERLASMGCHSTDITDALDASGADWRATHDAEVTRRRLDASASGAQAIGPKSYLDAASDPDATPSDLRQLAKSGYGFVRLAVARHPRTPPEALDSLVPSDVASSSDGEIVIALGQNPHCTVDTDRRVEQLMASAKHWTIGNELARVSLQPHHRPTGGTRHFVGGVEMPTPASLLIVHIEGSGWYLYYCDEDGNVQTDTWHSSYDDAEDQAQFEFGVAPEEWVRS